MLKKVVLVSANAGLLLVGPALNPLSAADYKHSGCSETTKARSPDDHADGKEFKHWCKDQWKIYKELHPHD